MDARFGGRCSRIRMVHASGAGWRKGTIEVSIDEMRRINERLPQLEDNLKAKDDRIRKLEERLGGQVQAPELYRHGFPTRQGNIKLAYSIGGDVDLNLTERIFVGADARCNFLDGGGDYGAYAGKAGFRW